jgi:hypothetical protein
MIHQADGFDVGLHRALGDIGVLLQKLSGHRHHVHGIWNIQVGSV